MDNIRELYQQTIIDHGRKPRNFLIMDNPTSFKMGHNPLCGDDLTLFLKIKDDVIQDISFQGEGCAISMASASLMSETLKGKTTTEALELFKKIHNMLLDGKEPDNIGKLTVLAGINEFPARVKCAALAWRTLEAILDGTDGEVTTE